MSDNMGMFVSLERFNLLSRLETITAESLAEQMHVAYEEAHNLRPIPWSEYPTAPKDMAIQEAALFLKIMRTSDDLKPLPSPFPRSRTRR